MNDVFSDTPRSIKVVANRSLFAVDLPEKPFNLPARLFEQLPFAVYVCNREGLVLRYNRRAAELWGRSPKLRDPDERFCGSYRMFRPDGSLLPHDQCPMADVLRTGVSVRGEEVHIERPDGSRGIALVDIEAVKDRAGKIVGAVNCFQDITERKRSEAQITNLAHEAEHRTKNILATVLAMVRFSHSDTPDDLKQMIEGRINALAKVHGLFVQSRWAGAELTLWSRRSFRLIAARETHACELTAHPYRWSRLRPRRLQSLCMSLQPMRQNTDRYRQRMVALKSLGRAWQTDASVCVGLN